MGGGNIVFWILVLLLLLVVVAIIANVMMESANETCVVTEKVQFAGYKFTVFVEYDGEEYPVSVSGDYWGSVKVGDNVSCELKTLDGQIVSVLLE